jgi:hypothetical protein
MRIAGPSSHHTKHPLSPECTKQSRGLSLAQEDLHSGPLVTQIPATSNASPAGRDFLQVPGPKKGTNGLKKPLLLGSIHGKQLTMLRPPPISANVDL